MTQPFRHPAIRYGVMVYLTSDKLITNTVITVSATIPFPQIGGSKAPDVHALLVGLGRADLFDLLRGGADDWRLMTEDEVSEYRDQEGNG